MKLYGLSLSPFVRKVLVVAHEKGIALELVPAGLGSKDPVFRAASPFGKMPALVDDDFMLADSSAIAHYFEALHPEPALIPAEPRLRARTIWFDEFADTILVACGAKIFFNRIVAPRFLKRDGDLAAADRAEAEELPPILDYLETQMQPSGFLVGDRLTLADIAVASPFANLAHAGCVIDAARYPAFATYLAGILARPGFAELITAENLALNR